MNCFQVLLSISTCAATPRTAPAPAPAHYGPSSPYKKSQDAKVGRCRSILGRPPLLSALKTKRDGPLSRFAFKCIGRPYGSAAKKVEDMAVAKVGPGGQCSPRHRMPFSSRNDEGSKCERVSVVDDVAGNVRESLRLGDLQRRAAGGVRGRGSHSLTSEINLSTFGTHCSR